MVNFDEKLAQAETLDDIKKMKVWMFQEQVRIQAQKDELIEFAHELQKEKKVIERERAALKSSLRFFPLDASVGTKVSDMPHQDNISVLLPLRISASYISLGQNRLLCLTVGSPLLHHTLNHYLILFHSFLSLLSLEKAVTYHKYRLFLFYLNFYSDAITMLLSLKQFLLHSIYVFLPLLHNIHLLNKKIRI